VIYCTSSPGMLDGTLLGISDGTSSLGMSLGMLGGTSPDWSP